MTILNIKTKDKASINNYSGINGFIDKKAFGAEVPDSVLHRILKEYGTNVTREFLDSVTIQKTILLGERSFNLAITFLVKPALGGSITTA